jgi:small ligand-binding sensory domain FIST
LNKRGNDAKFISIRIGNKLNVRESMKWSSAAVASPNLSDAIVRASKAACDGLSSKDIDCGIIFFSALYETAFPYLAALVKEHLPARVIFGCAAGGVIGGGREFEQMPAMAVAAARLPNVDIQVAHVSTEELPDEDAPPTVWRSWLGLSNIKPRLLLVFAHPYASRLDELLSGLDYAFADARVLGGIGGAGRAANEPVLFDGARLLTGGALIAAFGGEIAAEAVVAQGCRPIGRPLTITRCDRNVLLEVDGETPLHYLAELVESASDADRALMRHALHLGLRAESSDAAEADHEYLIRNLVGIDYTRGILAVGAPLREGMIVQFHLRDRVASAVDVRQALLRKRDIVPAGALMFSCLGRGKRFYQEPDFDSRTFADVFGPVPLAGFFCNGEIGPVGGATCIHGYTSSFALIRPAREG